MEEKKTSEISSSKQKRIEKEKKANAKKRNEKIINIVTILVAVVIIAGIIGAIAYSVVKSSNEIKASDDFSAELADNGFIKGVKASDYLTLADYKNLVIPASEVEYTEAELDADIEAVLENHKSLNKEAGTVKDGDTVNIDYIGTIDGVEFEGGNSNGSGSDLTIGSGTFIDDFEQQLIGYNVGDILNVEVTFPDDYGAPELAGKDAVFEVTINGLYEVDDFTDEFVANKLGAYATTVNGYYQYLKETNETEKLTSYIENFLKDNSTVIKYPKKFLKNLEATNRYADEQTYEYMNQMYVQYYGQGYNSFEEYNGMSEEEYLANLVNRSQDDCKNVLIDQAVLENEGISFSKDDVKAYINETYDGDQFDSMVEEYGLGYLAYEMMHDKVLEIVKENATIQ